MLVKTTCFLHCCHHLPVYFDIFAVLPRATPFNRRDRKNAEKTVSLRSMSSLAKSEFYIGWPCHRSTLQKIWIFLTKTPLRIARNSPNWKSLANMRVLEGVVHSFDLQHVAKYNFTKRTVLILWMFAFRPTLNDILRPLCRDLYWIKVGWQSYQTELWLGTERNGS